jgi:hypothetical protein
MIDIVSWKAMSPEDDNLQKSKSMVIISIFSGKNKYVKKQNKTNILMFVCTMVL